MAMKVIHLTTWKEICGIANYSNNLIKSIENYGIICDVYPINRKELQYFSLQEIKQHFSEFCELASNYDVVHIQHEHGFFHGSYSFDKSLDIFYEILVKLKRKKIKTVVTFHTDPIFIQPIYKALINTSGGLIKNVYNSVQTFKWKNKIAQFFREKNSGFTAVVHTKKSRLALINSGFEAESIQVINHGITERFIDEDSKLDKSECQSKLGLDKNVRLLSIFGFISSYKGYEVAINSLQYLPNNYYLAIIGGTHPNATQDKTLDEVLQLITQLKLTDRVRITGFVELDVLDLFHCATDICLAPYLSSTLSASGALTWSLNSGKPIIASKIPAFSELNQEADCMLMITPECPIELAWQVLNLEKDENLQKRLVNNALKYAYENSWGKIGLNHVKLYTNS
ncbi:MAG: glycosyltransferase [Calothrix sp. MO_192.B10]|nr:glycosyltransferase [Calothrix sp. MO_192.B10]